MVLKYFWDEDQLEFRREMSVFTFILVVKSNGSCFLNFFSLVGFLCPPPPPLFFLYFWFSFENHRKVPKSKWWVAGLLIPPQWLLAGRNVLSAGERGQSYTATVTFWNQFDEHSSISFCHELYWQHSSASGDPSSLTLQRPHYKYLIFDSVN